MDHAEAQPRGATPCPRSGAVTERARLRQCRSSREELSHVRGRGSGQEELPHVQGAVAAWAKEDWEELLHVQGQEGWPRDLIQGKEQWLHFARAAMKRYPKPKGNTNKTVGVTRGHQRADRLKPQSQKTSQSAHRTTALSNSMKLRYAVWGPPRWTSHGEELWQNAVHWRREWQTTSVFLPWEPHEQNEKAKWQDTERGTPQVGRCPICYWRSVEK